MQTKGETQKENEKLQVGRNKLIQGTAPIIRPAVRTTEMSKLIQLIRNDPNSLSSAEFILLQSSIGYHQAVKLLVEAKRHKLVNEKPNKEPEALKPTSGAEEKAVKADEAKEAPALQVQSEAENKAVSSIVKDGKHASPPDLGQELLQNGKSLLKTAMNKLKAMLTPKVKFKLGKEEHELWVEKGQTKNVVMMASKDGKDVRESEDVDMLVAGDVELKADIGRVEKAEEVAIADVEAIKAKFEAGADKLRVKACFRHNGKEYNDFNPQARDPRLKNVALPTPGSSKGMTAINKTTTTAHAELGAMNQSYRAGNKGGSAVLTVEGEPVCEAYCKKDIKKMAKCLELSKLEVHESETGNVYVFNKPRDFENVSDGGLRW